MADVAVVMRCVDRYGGAERFLLECLARWQHRHRLTLYATSWSDALLEEHGIDLDRVRLAPLHPLEAGPKENPINNLLVPKIWEQEIGTHDVYHFHQWPTHLIDRHPSVWYPHEPRRRYHDLLHERGVHIAAERLLGGFGDRTQVTDIVDQALHALIVQIDRLGIPDRIVANSHYTARYLERVYGRPVRDVVYPGVNPSEFADPAPPEDFVLAVNRYTPGKRYRLLLEAVARVEKVRLVTVGEDPTGVCASLARMAAHLGISDRVTFLKGISQGELRSLYARCRAVAFAPLREPFGIVALEALAAGKPLIAVEEGGYAEVVDETCALLVPPRPASIAEAIRHLFDHPEHARALGEKGREIARNYTWDRTASELSNILEETANDARPSSITFVTPTSSTTPCLPLIGVHYYCWYGDGSGEANWTGSDQPALGHYPSHAGWVIEEHLRCLADLGIDFLIINLHPSDPTLVCRELTIADRIDAIADQLRSPLRFTVRLDVPQTTAMIDHVVRLVSDDLALRPRFLNLSGRPLIFVQGDDGAADAVRSLASCCTVIPALMDRPAGTRCADGDPGSEQAWDAGKWTLPFTGRPHVWTISPGCISGNGTADVPRHGGINYQRRIDSALAADPRPDLLVVSSFNDYLHGTHIEESAANGTLYLDLTRELIRSMRSGMAVPREKRWTAV